MLNKVCLQGRLTKDIELKKTTSGTTYARFNLAVARNYKKDGQPEADFISCIAWKKTAELIEKYFKKGTQIIIEGRIQTTKYEHEGQTHYSTDVIVENIQFVESKKEKENTTAVDDTLFTTVVEDDLPF